MSKLTPEMQAELERLEESLSAPPGSLARGPRPTPKVLSERKRRRREQKLSRKRNR